MDSNDPLLDPDFGIDATRQLRNDHLLAIGGLVRILSDLVKPWDGSTPELSDEAVRRLVASVGSAAIPPYALAPHEQTLDGVLNREKLLEILATIDDVIGKAIRRADE